LCKVADEIRNLFARSWVEAAAGAENLSLTETRPVPFSLLFNKLRRNQDPPSILLKLFANLPGIALEDMKTISKTKATQPAFKQAQLLPVLTPEMIVQPGGTVAQRRAWLGTESAPENRSAKQQFVPTRLPQPRADQGTAERVLFGLLALSAAVGVGQGLVLMIELVSKWPAFNALVGRLLG